MVGKLAGKLGGVSVEKHIIENKKESDKIVIEVTNANEPPKVFINDERVPVNRLRINYETDTFVKGKHNFDLTYIDEEGEQLKTIGYMKGE